MNQQSLTAQVICRLTTSVIQSTIQEHLLNCLGDLDEGELREVLAILDNLQISQLTLEERAAKLKSFYSQLGSELRDKFLQEVDVIEREFEQELLRGIEGRGLLG